MDSTHLIQAYFDGELPDEEQGELFRILSEDPAARSVFNGHAKIAALLAEDFNRIVVPPNLQSDLFGKLGISASVLSPDLTAFTDKHQAIQPESGSAVTAQTRVIIGILVFALVSLSFLPLSDNVTFNGSTRIAGTAMTSLPNPSAKALLAPQRGHTNPARGAALGQESPLLAIAEPARSRKKVVLAPSGEGISPTPAHDRAEQRTTQFGESSAPSMAGQVRIGPIGGIPLSVSRKNAWDMDRTGEPFQVPASTTESAPALFLRSGYAPGGWAGLPPVTISAFMPTSFGPTFVVEAGTRSLRVPGRESMRIASSDRLVAFASIGVNLDLLTLANDGRTSIFAQPALGFSSEGITTGLLVAARYHIDSRLALVGGIDFMAFPTMREVDWNVKAHQNLTLGLQYDFR